MATSSTLVCKLQRLPAAKRPLGRLSACTAAPAAQRGTWPLAHHPAAAAAAAAACRRRCRCTARQQRSGGSGEPELSPQEALLAALAETGTPLDAIQLGRAPGDDEDWLDLLDAEAGDPWMRDVHVPEVVEELLGGDLTGALQQDQQRQQQRQQQQQPGKGSGP